jgi:hypothetical protein
VCAFVRLSAFYALCQFRAAARIERRLRLRAHITRFDFVRTWALALPPAEKPLPCTTSRAGVNKSEAARSPLATAAAGLMRPALFFVSLLSCAHEAFTSTHERTRCTPRRRNTAAAAARGSTQRFRGARPDACSLRIRAVVPHACTASIAGTSTGMHRQHCRQRDRRARASGLGFRPERRLYDALRLARGGAERERGGGSVQRDHRRRGTEGERSRHRDGQTGRRAEHQGAHFQCVFPLSVPLQFARGCIVHELREASADASLTRRAPLQDAWRGRGRLGRIVAR